MLEIHLFITDDGIATHKNANIIYEGIRLIFELLIKFPSEDLNTEYYNRIFQILRPFAFDVNILLLVCSLATLQIPPRYPYFISQPELPYNFSALLQKSVIFTIVYI